MSVSPALSDMLPDDDDALSDDGCDKPEVLADAEAALDDALQYQLDQNPGEAIVGAQLALDILSETMRDESAVPSMDDFWAAQCWRVLGAAAFRLAVNVAATDAPKGLMCAHEALQYWERAGKHSGYAEWSHLDRAELFYDVACGTSFISVVTPHMAPIALQNLHACRHALQQSVAGGDAEAPEACKSYGFRLREDADLNCLRRFMPNECAQLANDALFIDADES